MFPQYPEIQNKDPGRVQFTDVLPAEAPGSWSEPRWKALGSVTDAHCLPFSLLASSNNTGVYFRLQGERFRMKARFPDLLSSRQKTHRTICQLLGSLDTLAPLTLAMQ